MSHLIGRTLRQVPDDKHSLRSMSDPLTRPVPAYRYDPDPIETQCPMCTSEIIDGRWQHARGCILG